MNLLHESRNDIFDSTPDKNKNNLMNFQQVVYTGGPDGIKVRDA